MVSKIDFVELLLLKEISDCFWLVLSDQHTIEKYTTRHKASAN